MGQQQQWSLDSLGTGMLHNYPFRKMKVTQDCNELNILFNNVCYGGANLPSAENATQYKKSSYNSIMTFNHSVCYFFSIAFFSN